MTSDKYHTFIVLDFFKQNDTSYSLMSNEYSLQKWLSWYCVKVELL